MQGDTRSRPQPCSTVPGSRPLPRSPPRRPFCRRDPRASPGQVPQARLLPAQVAPQQSQQPALRRQGARNAGQSRERVPARRGRPWVPRPKRQDRQQSRQPRRGAHHRRSRASPGPSRSPGPRRSRRARPSAPPRVLGPPGPPAAPAAPSFAPTPTLALELPLSCRSAPHAASGACSLRVRSRPSRAHPGEVFPPSPCHTGGN